MSTCISPDALRIITASTECLCEWMRQDDGLYALGRSVADGFGFCAVSLDANGSHILVSGKVFCASDMQLIHDLGESWAGSFSPDGSHIAISYRGWLIGKSLVRLFDAVSGAELGVEFPKPSTLSGVDSLCILQPPTGEKNSRDFDVCVYVSLTDVSCCV